MAEVHSRDGTARNRAFLRTLSPRLSFCLANRGNGSDYVRVSPTLVPWLLSCRDDDQLSDWAGNGAYSADHSLSAGGHPAGPAPASLRQGPAAIETACCGQHVLAAGENCKSV